MILDFLPTVSTHPLTSPNYLKPSSMKLIAACFIAFLLSTSVYGQELANKNGLIVSYEASKIETAKKFDKWNVKLIINNTTGSDLFFYAIPTGLMLDAPYAKIDVPNAKGLLTVNLKYLNAKIVDGVKSFNGRGVFKIPAGTFTEDFETSVAIGEVPVVKGAFLISPVSYNEVTTGQTTAVTSTPATATPAATTAPNDPASVTVLQRASLTSEMKLLINQAIAMPASPEIRLVLHSNGNLVLYNDGGKSPLWSSNTEGKQVSYGEMQADGNFVLKTAAGEEVWSTDTAGNPGSMLVLGQEGTIAVFTKSFQNIWQAP
jgi:hypothetical protein